MTITYTVCRVDENNLTVYTPEQLNEQAQDWISSFEVCDNCGWAYLVPTYSNSVKLSGCKYKEFGCTGSLRTPTREDFDREFPQGIQ